MNPQKGEFDPAELSFFESLQTLIDVSAKSSPPRTLSTICGVDAAYPSSGNRAVAVASLLSARDGRVLESFSHVGHFTYPYFPGLFYLHEGPSAVAAVEGLKQRPDLVCFDAHGRSHPRRAGLATLCGKILEIPSIGLAKSRLVGEAVPYKEGVERIVDRGEQIGYLTRCRSKKKYWSQGYAITMKELRRIISLYGEICVRSVEIADEMARAQI